MTEFQRHVDDFLTEFFRLNPTWATDIGAHAHDDRWPDLTEQGRQERLAFIGRWHATFGAMHDLEDDDAIDRDLLIGELEAARFSETELREETWNPLEWIYLLGGGLFSLLAREFAPLDVRLGSVAGRLEGVPAVVDAAKAALVGLDGRPVGRFQTETALKQLPGVEELIADALRSADESTDPAVAEIRPRLEAGAKAARAAMAGFEQHLRNVVLPASEGEGRLGPELFAAKMRHTMRSAELTPERLLAAAERDYVKVRAELVRIARELWPAWGGNRPIPDDEGTLVRSVLDAVAVEHPKADELLDFCREENRRIEAFCRDQDLIGLADEPLEIRWTPVFMRAFGGAMLHSPGPLDKGQKAFFSITPTPDDWTDEQRESYLREDNNRMLRLLTIHEAVPGHYLQLTYSNRCASLPRSIFASGVFAEGWAVYVTQVMMDVGYGAEDPALMLVHWKFYLRSITNALMDIRLHAGEMDEAEAMRLMVEGGFQEEGEAANKWDRARLSSTQLCEYFLGSQEMHGLEREARRRAAAEGREFMYRPFLESVISHGSPSTPVIRDILFG